MKNEYEVIYHDDFSGNAKLFGNYKNSVEATEIYNSLVDANLYYVITIAKWNEFHISEIARHTSQEYLKKEGLI